MSEKTASQLMRETFSTGYKKWIEYCNWVINNQILLDLHNRAMGNKEPTYYDEGLPTMELTLRL